MIVAANASQPLPPIASPSTRTATPMSTAATPIVGKISARVSSSARIRPRSRQAVGASVTAASR